MKKILGIICFLTFMINAGLAAENDLIKEGYIENGAKPIIYGKRQSLLFDVPGDGSCFFYATGISRSAFKQRVEEVKGKNIRQLFPHAGDRLTALEKAITEADLSSAIYNNNEYVDSDQTDTNGNSPSVEMSTAELFSFLFDCHLSIFVIEEGELKHYATYNPSGKIKINLLCGSYHYQLIVFDNQTDVEKERERGARCLEERNKLPENRNLERCYRESVNALPIGGGAATSHPADAATAKNSPLSAKDSFKSAAYPNNGSDYDSGEEPLIKRSRSEDFQGSSHSKESRRSLLGTFPLKRGAHHYYDIPLKGLTNQNSIKDFLDRVKTEMQTKSNLALVINGKSYSYSNNITLREIAEENGKQDFKELADELIRNNKTGYITVSLRGLENRSDQDAAFPEAATSSPPAANASPVLRGQTVNNDEANPELAAQYKDMRSIFDGTPLKREAKKPETGVYSISSLKGLLKYIDDNKSSINANDTSIVFDIDDTLVKDANGGDNIRASKLIEKDLPDTLKNLTKRGFKVFFVSGRRLDHTDATISFFKQQGIACDGNNLRCIGSSGHKAQAIRELCPEGSIFFVDDKPAYLAGVLSNLKDRNLKLFGYNVKEEDITNMKFMF